MWATACERAFWPAGTFWSAYCGNRDEAVEGVIDAVPIAAAVSIEEGAVDPQRPSRRHSSPALPSRARCHPKGASIQHGTAVT